MTGGTVQIHCHPVLNKTSHRNAGIYRTHKPVDDKPKPLSYVSIGYAYDDRIKKPNSRFGGKQFITNPPKNTSGDVGHFHKNKYSSEKYVDTNTYLKKQPLDKRSLGFGSKDAHKRDEFTTTVRTEQYREQLKFESLTKPADVDGKVMEAWGEQSKKETSFPAGLKETKFLYDIGRSQETAFDPKSSRDTFYNALMCKSRTRTNRRTGGYHLSSSDIGSGVEELDHGKCKPTHGHHRATKEFYDRSHLNIAW
jgi:hypothetical protein